MEEQKNNEKNQNSTNDNKTTKTKGKNIGMAVVAYILFFIPFFTKSKDDPFVKYHVKQGLILFIVSFIAMIISRMPIIGLFFWLFNIAIFIWLILGIMNAAQGKEKPLPFIGQFAEKFKF